LKTKDGLDLKELFEQTYKAFKEKGVELYRAGKTESVGGEFFQPLREYGNSFWKFKISLTELGLEWYMEPNRLFGDNLNKSILAMVDAKFYLYGYISQDGFYRRGSNAPEKFTDISIAEIFFGAVELYEKIFRDSEKERNRLLKEAENKFKEYLAKFF
jgi:hypothetical protein